MKRLIKFRGRCIGNGTFVYGDLTHNFDDVYVNGWQVDPESVAQFVGYDCEGAEVYEGDTVYDEHDIGYVVRLIPQVPVAKMTVKEDDQ